MNDPAIPGAGGHAEFRKSFEKKNVAPMFGHGPRNRTTYNSAADNDNICLIHRYLKRPFAPATLPGMRGAHSRHFSFFRMRRRWSLYAIIAFVREARQQ